MNYAVTSLEQRYDLLDEMNRIGGEAWPEFMLHDPVAIDHWEEIVEVFREFQLMLMDGDEIVAIVNTVPLSFPGRLDELPDEGVDWGVKKAISDRNTGVVPNTLLGVQVVVEKNHGGQGLSTIASRQMLDLAKALGFSAVLIPLRPSNKHKYPLIDMEDYVQWQNGSGLPFDNWLRVHTRLGGKIIGICAKSMYIPGTVREWEAWTGMTFPGSGQYLVPGALNPIVIDLQQDNGTYYEPNVWVCHSL